MQKLDHIDSIRGIAILMVVLVHTAQSVSDKGAVLTALCDYGQMGVQLFFVASAFTLCQSWIGRAETSHRVRNFWIRRFFRIAPIYYLGIPVYFAVETLQYAIRTGDVVIPQQYGAANILANLMFVNGFFPPANNNIVPGGWSIGTEMAFYALFPAAMAIMAKRSPLSRRGALLLFIVIVLGSAAATALAMSLTAMEIANNNFVYFNLAVQGPVFAVGVLYFFMRLDRSWPTLPLAANSLGVLIGTGMSLWLWHFGDPRWFALIPTLSAVSFVFLFEALDGRKQLNPAWLRRLGQWSFSIYLFHFIFAHKIVYALSPALVAAVGPQLALAIVFPATVACTAAIASVTERRIERPFIELGRRTIQRWDRRPLAVSA